MRRRAAGRERERQGGRAGDGDDPDDRAAAGPVRVRAARLQVRQARDGGDALQHGVRTRRGRGEGASSCRRSSRSCRDRACSSARLRSRLCSSALVVGERRRRTRRSIPRFTAVFSSTSYAPGGIATLRVTTPVKNLDLQILRAGAERAWSSVGRPWGPEQHIRFRRAGVNLVRVRLGAWTSGLYFARLTTSVGKTRVRTRRSSCGRTSGGGAASRSCCRRTAGRPTTSSTSARDGRGDSWYVDPKRQHVQLGRPFARRRQAAALPHAAARLPPVPRAQRASRRTT